MGQRKDLLEALKRELRARKITYKMLAGALGLAESSVKRLFSVEDMPLQRLEQICEFAEIEFARLVRARTDQDHMLTSLTEGQETQLVQHPELFLVAVCLMNLSSFDEILANYNLTAARLITHMSELDRIGFIKFLPNNRYRLLLAHTFAWLPNGPMQQYFKRHTDHFFDSDFARPQEMMILINGRLSETNLAALKERLKRVARDFSEQHHADSTLPIHERQTVTLLMAARPWHLPFMQELIRKPAAARTRRN